MVESVEPREGEKSREQREIEKSREQREHEKREQREHEKSKDRRNAEVIVIDLGKSSSKNVRDLRKGRGPLMDDVEDAIEELREAKTISGSGTPVVVIVERRIIGSGSGMLPMLLPPGIPGIFPFGLGGDRIDDDADEDEDNDD